MLNIVTYPHPILKKRMEEIKEFNNEIKFLSEQMFKTMYKYNAIGLAANQAGLEKRMLVMDCNNNPLVVVNPEILYRSEKTSKQIERCLSFPSFVVDVERPCDIIVKYQELNGDFIEKGFSGIEARAFQHEYEHLEGETFLKYLPLQHRLMIERTFKDGA